MRRIEPHHMFLIMIILVLLILYFQRPLFAKISNIVKTSSPIANDEKVVQQPIIDYSLSTK
jgi:hypothetical protein